MTSVSAPSPPAVGQPGLTDDPMSAARCLGDGTTCGQCGKHFSHAFYFSTHIASHASGLEGQIVGQCGRCGLVFYEQETYVAHMVSAQELIDAETCPASQRRPAPNGWMKEEEEEEEDREGEGVVELDRDVVDSQEENDKVAAYLKNLADLGLPVDVPGFDIFPYEGGGGLDGGGRGRGGRWGGRGGGNPPEMKVGGRSRVRGRGRARGQGRGRARGRGGAGAKSGGFPTSSMMMMMPPPSSGLWGAGGCHTGRVLDAPPKKASPKYTYIDEDEDELWAQDDLEVMPRSGKMSRGERLRQRQERLSGSGSREAAQSGHKNVLDAAHTSAPSLSSDVPSSTPSSSSGIQTSTSSSSSSGIHLSTSSSSSSSGIHTASSSSSSNGQSSTSSTDAHVSASSSGVSQETGSDPGSTAVVAEDAIPESSVESSSNSDNKISSSNNSKNNATASNGCLKGTSSASTAAASTATAAATKTVRFKNMEEDDDDDDVVCLTDITPSPAQNHLSMSTNGGRRRRRGGRPGGGGGRGRSLGTDLEQVKIASREYVEQMLSFPVIPDVSESVRGARGGGVTRVADGVTRRRGGRVTRVMDGGMGRRGAMGRVADSVSRTMQLLGSGSGVSTVLPVSPHRGRPSQRLPSSGRGLSGGDGRDHSVVLSSPEGASWSGMTVSRGGRGRGERGRGLRRVPPQPSQVIVIDDEIEEVNDDDEDMDVVCVDSNPSLPPDGTGVRVGQKRGAEGEGRSAPEGKRLRTADSSKEVTDGDGAFCRDGEIEAGRNEGDGDAGSEGVKEDILDGEEIDGWKVTISQDSGAEEEEEDDSEGDDDNDGDDNGSGSGGAEVPPCEDGDDNELNDGEDKDGSDF
ncbi:protein qua-1 [Aplysia californica]|uniref:Protein qua-1 n=1 Tax=Aplysia californica TaxID=6500 RepID=A0ABM1W227_APLCA|nr:protein qua-1 [Aplysia californica]